MHLLVVVIIVVCWDTQVGLRGSVVRAANIAPLITELNFTCSRCSSEVAVTTVEGRFEYPASCPKKCSLMLESEDFKDLYP